MPGDAALGGAATLVPAQAVHCPPPGGPALGPGVLRWTSNGMGAHPDRAAALLHALLEAIERDRLARALPEGFTEGALARRLLDPRTLAGARRRGRRRGGGARGARVPGSPARRGDVGAGDAGRALAACEVAPPDLAADAAPRGQGAARGSPPRAGWVGGAGLGSRWRPRCWWTRAAARSRWRRATPAGRGRDEALSAALLEAAQSRATEIHGAREDVLHGDRASAAPLAALLAAARPARSAAAMPDLARRLRGGAPPDRRRGSGPRGIGPALAVDLAGPAGVHVVKVLAPGLLLSELL